MFVKNEDLRQKSKLDYTWNRVKWMTSREHMTGEYRGVLAVSLCGVNNSSSPIRKYQVLPNIIYRCKKDSGYLSKVNILEN